MPRKKSEPKRLDIVGGIARISMVDDDDEAGAASSSAKPTNEDEEEEAELDDIMGGVTTPSSPPAATTTASTAPKRKREETAKGEKQPAARTSVKYFEIEGDTPEELAGAYTTTDAAAGATYDSMGFFHQQQLMSTGRIEAAAKKGGVELECKAGEGRRGTFVARFSGNRKKFEDEGPLYTADEVAEVFAAVMRRQSTKRRKAGPSTPCFALDQLALRSPPFFWSLYHAFGGNVPLGLKTVLSEAEEMMES